MRALFLAFLLISTGTHASDAVDLTEPKLRVGASGELALQVDLYRDFSIRYDSFGPSGVLGNSFKISGVSGIVRCSKRDQPQSVPALSSTDGLCLSGDILNPVDGQFVPESSPYTRVIPRGGNNSSNPAEYTGPDYFEVHSRDDTTNFYGRTPDSKLERIRCGGTTGVACATVQWALNRTVDNLGNYVDYVYQENPVTIPAQADGTTIPGTEQVLKRIEYGGRLNLPGQSGATQAHYGQIEFDYETRPTATWRIGWMADSREAQTQELTRIRVRERNDQNQLVQLRSYRLTYIDSNSGSGVRLLTEIQECRDESAGAVCLKPTKFTWQVERNFIGLAQDSSNPDYSDFIVDAEVGDIDADGMQDVVYRTVSRKIYVMFSTWVGTGNFQLQRLSQTPLTLPDNTPLDYNLIDMDGDGRDDLVMVSRVGNEDRWVVLRSMGRPLPNGRVFSTTGSQLGNYLAYEDSVVGDFSGDGILDILDVRPNANPAVLGADHRVRKWQRTSKGPELSAEIPVRFDFATGAPCAAQTAGRTCKLEKFDGRYQRFLEDADGDGAADLFAFVRVYQNGAPVGDARFHVMRFAGFENPGTANEIAVFKQLWADTNNSIPPPSASTVRQPPQVADFNGDGLPDLLHKVVGASGDWRFVPNTGKGFAENLSLTVPRANPEWDVAYTSVAETNGNGRVELIRMSIYRANVNEWVPSLTLDANTLRGRLLQGMEIGGGFCPGNLSSPFCGNVIQAGGYFRNYYTDLNGDGVADLLIILHGAPNGAELQQVNYRLAEPRYSPRDVITAVEDAFGAKTAIRYLPLTNRAVYVRDVNSRLDAAPNNDEVSSFGRGSPVLDMLSPMFVVAEITSTAPTFGDRNSVTRTRYRYAGAKVQLGGRGFLGFREVTAFEENHKVGSSNFIDITRTRYRQDFPFVGMPELSERFVRTGDLALDISDANNNNLLLACHANSEFSQGCFASAPVGTEPAEQAHPAFGGQRVSSSEWVYGCLGLGDAGNGAAGEQCAAVWGNQACLADLLTANLALPVGPDQASPFRPAVNKPVFPFVRLQEDKAFDLRDGALASSTVNGYCYTDGFGNPTQTVTAHFDRSGNEAARQRTFNTYINSVTEVPGTEPVVQWRIGRLASTASTTRRPNPASAGQFLTRSRNANFLYDFTAPMRTGLLIGESAEPGAGEAAAPFVRQRYFHDVFGNRTLTMTCSNDVPLTDCDDPTDVSKVRMQPAAAGLGSRVHRYSKTQFDARGRYEVATRAPYFSATAVNNLVELTDSEVLSRDVFGQPTHVRKLVDQNVSSYAESKAEYGVLGRLSRTMTETAEGLFGVESNIRYRWCRGRNQGVDEVDCPADAVYRQETTTTEQPTVWTYFDPLARPIIEVKQTFNDPNDPKLELRAGFANKQLVATCVYFDRRGREARRTEPFFLTRAPVAGAPSFNNGADVPCTPERLWTLHDYDALDRSRRVSEPNGAYTEIKIGRAISSTADPLSERRETFRGQTSNDVLSESFQKNPMGEVIATTDIQGLVVQTFFDAYGNPARVVRDGGVGAVETIHVHDAMGRKISESDPDSGNSTFAYNGAGEIIRTEDARGVVVSSEYDARGRLVKRRTQLPRFNISGQVTGLSGGALTLQLNGANNITVSQSGGFVFNNAVTLNSDFAVTISSAPATVSCTVQNGQGSLVSANVSNVQVTCLTNTYSVGGSISGLGTGLSVVLRNATTGENLTRNANGAYSFATAQATGATYNVTVQTQPTGQTCTVANGSGTVGSANVTNVNVSCTNTYTVGGSISGLGTGLSVALRNATTGENLSRNANGVYSFATAQATGATYNVTVQTQPSGQTCTVANGSGTVGSANVTNVNVTCTTNTYTVGGSISGLGTGLSVVLRNSTTGENLSRNANGAYSFATAQATGATYAVTVQTQPAGQTCTVANSSGTVGSANVTNVNVSCITNTYTVGGSISGLGTGLSVVLRNATTGENLSRNANGAYSFATAQATGATYSVTVQTQPTGQTCTVANGSGTVGSANVTNVNVTCTTNTYTVGGSISGLGTGLSAVLRNATTGENLTRNANGAYSFATAQATGATYNVTVQTQPTGQTCTVANASGTVGSANVTNVNVSCITNTYTVGGSISGLGTGLSVVLRNALTADEGENLSRNSNGVYSFVLRQRAGTAYNVTVQTQPTGQTCTVANGSGTVSTANVTNVNVTCTTNTYTVGGALTGLLSGRSLVLRLNGAQNLTLTANGNFQFANAIPHASDYTVTLLTLPLGQTCTLNNGAGTVNAANVTNVQVACVQRPAAFGSLPAPGATVDFGGLAVGQSSERTILVANGAPEGSADLAISCTLPAGSAFQFSGVSFPINLAAPDERELRIRLLVPQGSAGNLSVQLQCTHNASGSSTAVNWTLTGSVVQELIFRSGFEAQ